MIGWSITVVYFAIGLLHSRHLINRWSQDPDALCFDDDQFERTSAAMGALLLGFVWPCSVAFDLLRGWLWKPVDRREARFEQLRKDRDDWRQREHSAETEQERTMARDIRKTLDDILKR